MALNFVNEFVVAAPIDATWQALVDVERVARCLPGATIRPGETADTFNGSMRIKLGPMTMEYQGVAEISSVDHEGHRVSFNVRGKELRGQGTAAAVIHNSLTSEGDTTRVLVESALNVTGRPAQFGRGIMQDVAASMLRDFATCLSTMLADGAKAPAPSSSPADSS